MDVCTSAYLWRLENLQNQFLTLHHVSSGDQTYIRLNVKTTWPTEPFISHHGNDFLILNPTLCVSVHVHAHAILSFAEKNGFKLWNKLIKY